MLKNVTQTFINNSNAREVTLSEYVVLNGSTIPVKAVLKDDAYENGNFIGSFIFKTISFEVDNQYDFRNREFVYYKKINGESIKMGTFITTEVTDNDTTEIAKIVGMDYGLKTQVEYTSSLNYDSGQVTLLDVWNEACQLSGLVSGVDHFTNDDFIVDNDQFTSTGSLIRNVFQAIGLSSGTFIKVMNDDKIYPIFNVETNDIIEDYVELEDKRDTHPWTCIRLGMSQVQGENVDYMDQELIAQYGENWLIINDNPFAYTQEKRQQLIMNIFNQIKEFGYSAFTTKTSFKPYLTTGDVIRFKNKDGNLIKSIILRYEHNFDEITLQAPSETSAEVKYIYPLSAVDIAKNAEVKVNKYDADITALTQRTTTVEAGLSNTYTIDQVNTLVQNAEDGVVNTFSEAGGNNIFRNTGLWYDNKGQDKATNPYEYWYGVAVRSEDIKANNRAIINLQNGTFYQTQNVANGSYCVSFKYKKKVNLSNITVNINGASFTLDKTTDTEFVQPITVSTNNIIVSFISDTDDSCEIYDLMVNAGSVKLAYSQNQNETTTDTVKISKGIEITSSETNTRFRADTDGIRIYNTRGSNNDPTTEYTETGTKTNTLEVKDEATILQVKWQLVDDQTWLTRL